MIGWLAVAFAVVVAVIVLGFCAYELRWKLIRLTGDLHELESLGDRLRRVQVDLVAVQARARRRAAGEG